MSEKFLSFGSQYYRSPTPLREDWEEDIRNFKEQGFNTIKIWAQWRTNNPKEGVYCFDDLRELLDLSNKNHIKVIINIILDIAPAWFFKKYPESIMIMANGRKLMPQATEYRQAGGAPGPCYHHPEAIEAKNVFVEKLSEEFCSHPALLLWDLWNEPELTCGIAREADLSTMVCYCDATSHAFIQWLKDRYTTIDTLNATWQRNYNDFDEVELPRNPRTYRDMIDWRTFFADTLEADLANRVRCVKKYDQEHPVMVHTVPPPYFNMINACCDDYKMAKHCDLFGNSIASSPFPVALNVSTANGKEVMNAEIHAVGGETFNRPGIASYNDFKRHIYTPFARGIKGFLFWQYKPEILGRESPAWGLTDLNGNSTDNLEYARRINNILQEHIEITSDCKPQAAKIAIIRDNHNEIFTWCATNSTDKYMNSLFGAFHAFYHLNYNVDIITTEQMLENGLDSYHLVYYPLPYYLSQPITDIIKKWIEQGGFFVSEAFFGAYRAENGLHSKTIPGFSFDEVFGAKELRATTASRFVAAYGEKWWDANNDLDIAPIHFKTENEEFDLNGYYFYEELVPSTAKTIGYYGNKTASIVENDFGKGKAVMTGSLPGYGYEITRHSGNLKFFDYLAQKANVMKNAEVNRENIRADLLYSASGMVLILQNMGLYEGPVRLSFNTDPNTPAIHHCMDTDSKKTLDFVREANKINLEINIAAQDVRLLIFH